MKLKNNIFTTLLLAIGLIMHHITPGILGGMKFDFLLIFMFAAMIINSRLDNCLLTGLLGGFLSAMTTTFPGGQIPNMIDKLVTCLVVYLLLTLIRRFDFNIFTVGLIGSVGTLVSGTTFLVAALYIVGLPAPFGIMFTGIVIPTIAVNTVGTVFIYKIVKKALRVTGSFA